MFEIHPLNDQPDMRPEEFDALTADLHEHGLLVPLLLFHGAILDGKHRYRAIQSLADQGYVVPIRVDVFEGTEAEAYARSLSLNVTRRHLTDGQKAMCGLRLMELLQAEGAHKGPGKAAIIAGEKAHVGKTTIYRAKKVRDAHPDLGEQMENGNLSVYAAEQIVKDREGRIPDFSGKEGGEANALPRHSGASEHKTVPTGELDSRPSADLPLLPRWALQNKTLDELQRAVGEWGNVTFPKSTGKSIHAHLRKEAKELYHACEDWLRNQAPVDENVAWPTVMEEVADVLLIALHIAHRRRFSLFDVIYDKFVACQTREWGEPDEEGVVEHVRV